MNGLDNKGKENADGRKRPAASKADKESHQQENEGVSNGEFERFSSLLGDLLKVKKSDLDEAHQNTSK